MARPQLIDVLRDFGAPPAPPRAPAGERLQPVRIGEAEIAARVAAAVAAAEAEVTARLAAAHQAEREAADEAHDGALGALRAEFDHTLAALIPQRIREAEERMAAATADAAARLIGSVLSEAVQKRSIARLTELIADAAADRDAVRIEVRGPQSFFEALAAAMPERRDALSFKEAPGFDLTVSVDGALFETRLSEWSAVLAEALE